MKRVIVALAIFVLLGILSLLIVTAYYVHGYYHRLASGTTLLYEVADPNGISMDEVKTVALDRIDPTRLKCYTITPRGHGRLEIRLPGADLGEVRTVKSLLSQNGYLELRILAGPKNLIKDDEAKRLVAQRLAGQATPTYSSCEWVRLQFNSRTQWTRAADFLFQGSSERPTRDQCLDRHDGYKCYFLIHKEVAQASTSDSAAAAAPQLPDIEVLVLRDPPRVTGADFSEVRKTCGPKGDPAIDFQMRDSGKERLGELSGKHVDERMAFVLDGQVFNAPNITGRISNVGEITFNGNLAERDLVLALLMSGTIDVDLRLLSEQYFGPGLSSQSFSLPASSSSSASAPDAPVPTTPRP